jgi:formate dehydrogenase subunit gamma
MQAVILQGDKMNQRAIEPADVAGQVRQILAGCGTTQDQLMPVLHAIQDATGFVPPDMLGEIASTFNLSRAEVHGVVTFYHYFRSEPPARHVIQICRAEACQSMGGDALLAHAEQTLGCRLHEHGAGGEFALDPVYCLGQCATAPAIMIGGALHARVTPARFDALLARAKESV